MTDPLPIPVTDLLARLRTIREIQTPHLQRQALTLWADEVERRVLAPLREVAEAARRAEPSDVDKAQYAALGGRQ
jgi:hypothetical protein